ncbi:hypothetical protein GCM10009675_36600 [Prauserella alba]|uniref:Uncharacterized protein n=1 Tax=Prauserella alba TaxID=176898 RepID=A0ABP4G364_9PSEU
MDFDPGTRTVARRVASPAVAGVVAAVGAVQEVAVGTGSSVDTESLSHARRATARVRRLRTNPEA